MRMIRIPHLETDITQSCQLSCVGCNHHVPMWRQAKHRTLNSARPEQVEKDLNHLARFLHADRWGALGGEPTLHPQLVEFLQIARASGISDRLEVWTNGLLLPRLSKSFWMAFDVLVLSIYPGKHTDQSLDWIVRRCADEGVELVIKDERNAPNFKTLLEPTPTNAEETKRKFAGCFFRHFSRVANHGYFFTCCCAPHMPMLVQGREFGDDGILIDGLTEAQLRAYLTRTEPLGACTVCAGRDTAQPLTWHEERDPKRWLAASAGGQA